jgi:hypothetical protein
MPSGIRAFSVVQPYALSRVLAIELRLDRLVNDPIVLCATVETEAVAVSRLLPVAVAAAVELVASLTDVWSGVMLVEGFVVAMVESIVGSLVVTSVFG